MVEQNKDNNETEWVVFDEENIFPEILAAILYGRNTSK